MKEELIRDAHGSESSISHRPKISVDIDTLLILREKQHWGWRRIADYFQDQGHFVSHMTVKRRYQEAKRQLKKEPAEQRSEL